ncbi:MAG: GTPase ObgE [Desulfomonile sp.]|nr:GTPase ObgE [Desulfomonile sp.]
MKFVDQARITVVSGSGGRGCVSFRREAFVPKGGPDGGDGGKGGDVIVRADPSVHTLLDCQYRQLYRAQRGAHGMGKDKHGRNGEEMVIRVPVGTLVIDAETGELIADLNRSNADVVVAQGGRGGRGNARFVTSTNRAPRRYEDGEPGRERTLLLELKLIADVGLVGMPNAGKSTLISKVSKARPKIADYPFTTREPALGVVRMSGGFDFVMADIPGLIEDASKGAGLGLQFLRHVERTRVLVHLIDPSPYLTPSPEERFSIIMRELDSHAGDLLHKPMIAVITKMDLPENKEPAAHLRKSLEAEGFRVHAISAVTGKGVNRLLTDVARTLRGVRRPDEP